MRSGASTYQRVAGGMLGMRHFGPESHTTAPVNLLCLSHAGGQSAGFMGLARTLPEEWNVWAVDAPAHGGAIGEPLSDVGQIAAFFLSHLPRASLRDVVILGHSLGGYVGLKLAALMAEENRPARALVLCATRPPDRHATYPKLTQLSDEALLRRLTEYGGIPSAMLIEPALFARNAKPLRADLTAFESFEQVPEFTRPPMCVIGGADDRLCDPGDVVRWTESFPQCALRFVPGDHFFVSNCMEAVAAHLVDFAQRCLR
jgi:pyochelin biosynthetic protein PchC